VIDGNPKYTALTIGEFAANFLGSTVKLTAKAAFVDPRTGHTHGWTSCESWSPETIEKMREFVASLENDLARQHFQGHTAAVTGALDNSKPSGIAAGGIGEHASGNGEQY
jgi:hypothetical protein